MGDDEQDRPVELRVKLRYETIDAMVEQFAVNVGKSGLFLPTKTLHPVGTQIKFELRLADDSSGLVGIGTVKAVRKPDPSNPRAVPGMSLELMRVSRDGRERLLEMMERRRALGLPEVLIPSPEDVDSARELAQGPTPKPIVAPADQRKPKVRIPDVVRIPEPAPKDASKRAATPPKGVATIAPATPAKGVATSTQVTPAKGVATSIQVTPAKGVATSTQVTPAKGVAASIAPATPAKGVATSTQALATTKGVATSIAPATPAKGVASSTQAPATPAKGVATSTQATATPVKGVATSSTQATATPVKGVATSSTQATSIAAKAAEQTPAKAAPISTAPKAAEQAPVKAAATSTAPKTEEQAPAKSAAASIVASEQTPAKAAATSIAATPAKAAATSIAPKAAEQAPVKPPIAAEPSAPVAQAKSAVASEQTPAKREPIAAEQPAKSVVASEQTPARREPIAAAQPAPVAQAKSVVASEQTPARREPIAAEQPAKSVVASEQTPARREPIAAEQPAPVAQAKSVASEQSRREQPAATEIRPRAAEAPARRSRRGLAIAGALVAVAVGAVLLFVNRRPTPTAKPPTEIAAAPIATVTPDAAVVPDQSARLVESAERAITEGRIATPPTNNALELIVELERAHPGDERAQALRRRAVDQALASAQILWDHGKRDSARRLYAEVLRFEPDNTIAKPRSQPAPTAFADSEQAAWLATQVDLAIVDGRLIEPADRNALAFLLELRKYSSAGEIVRIGHELASAISVEAKKKPEQAATMLAAAKQARGEAAAEGKPGAVTTTTTTTTTTVAKTNDKTTDKTNDTEPAKQWIAKGNASLAAKRFAEAATSFQRALAADASAPAALAGLAEATYNQGDFQRAVDTAKRAVAQTPRNVAYRMTLAKSYFKLERYADAISQWEKVLEINPANRLAKKNIEMAKSKM